MQNSSELFKGFPGYNRSLPGRGAFSALSESMLVGLFFYFGFLLAGGFDLIRIFIPSKELALMSLGAAFSYAFIFVYRKNYQINFGLFTRQAVAELFRTMSYAYILHLSILFLVKDSGFSSVRSAIGLAFLLGFAGILVNRFIVSRIPGFNLVREGKKILIIRGMGRIVAKDVEKGKAMADSQSESTLFPPNRLRDRVPLESPHNVKR